MHLVDTEQFECACNKYLTLPGPWASQDPERPLPVFYSLLLVLIEIMLPRIRPR